MVQMFET